MKNLNILVTTWWSRPLFKNWQNYLVKIAEFSWSFLKVAKVPVKFQWPCSDMWQPEKPRWSVYTEDFKCTLSEFQRYVEWKVDIVKNSCSKTRKRLQLRLIYHCICHRDSKWKFSHWCTSWCTGNEKPSNFMFSWINLRPYPKVKLDNE